MTPIRRTYPIVCYPEAILNFFNEGPPFPVDHYAPVLRPVPGRPDEPAPFLLSPPLKSSNYFKFIAAAIVLFACALVSLFLSFKGNLDLPLSILAGFGGFGLFFVISASLMNDRYKEELKEYNIAKRHHSDERNKYEEALAVYQLSDTDEARAALYYSALKDYSRGLMFYIHAATVERYEIDAIHDKLTDRQIVLNRSCDFQQRDQRGRTGVSEDFFCNGLEGRFPGKMFRQISFVNRQFGFATKSPDIVYADFDRNIFIDIEVDEPYTFGEDQKTVPIHYLYPDNPSVHKDDDRNSDFADHGWIVVRFTERQVSHHTEACITFIAEVIRSLDTGRRTHEFCYPFRQDAWTREEALAMSEKNFRMLTSLQIQSIGSSLLTRKLSVKPPQDVPVPPDSSEPADDLPF